MYNILVCDDDRDIVAALVIYLAAEGYTVLTASNGREALDVAAREDVQLALLDIMMPGLDGLAVTAALRERSNIPVILLTAKSEDTDKVLGLQIGADDYVTKPFNPVELTARVKSALRRYAVLGGMEKTPSALVCGGIALDDEAKSVTRDGEPVALTPLEFALLRHLMRNRGRVYSSAELYRAVWGDAPLGGEGTVAVHIRHLREKLEIVPAEPRYIKVVWGQGYKMEASK